MQEAGVTPPALANRPSLESSMALLYNDYKTIKCSRLPTTMGYGRIPYSELAIFAQVQGYRGSEVRDFVEELQWVDVIYNEVEHEHLAERSKTKSNDASTTVRPPNAKQQAEQREARRSKLRPPINGVR